VVECLPYKEEVGSSTLSTPNMDKLMKQYPRIKEYPHTAPQCKIPIYMFEKIDGSNLRVEWTQNKWNKYGRRHGLLDDSHPLLKEKGCSLLQSAIKKLIPIFETQRWSKATAFFEFYGPNSFAGTHLETDKHKITLIDVFVHKKGFVLPKQFIELFEKNIEIAKCIYTGLFTRIIQQQITQGVFPGQTFEGVVCKSNSYITPGRPLMFKWKSLAWLKKLAIKCNGNTKMFKKLI
jgi:hypothetical protein